MGMTLHQLEQTMSGEELMWHIAELELAQEEAERGR